MIKEGNLVMLRLSNKVDGYQYNTWVRILFIDNDGTFVGKCERKDNNLESININETRRFIGSEMIRAYKGEQFCYSDNVTICVCKSLCRNKC